MTYLEEYALKVLSGDIFANEKIKKMYKILLDKLKNPNKYKPYKFDESKATIPIEFIEKFCKQAQGNQGKELKLMLFQKACIQALFGFVDDIGNRQYNELLLIVGRKNGKALCLDTDIPTHLGWKKMKDLKVGDKVFDRLGRETSITYISEVFYNHKCYEVEFEDGEVIKADAEHLWCVKTPKKQLNLTTEQMKDDFKRRRKDNKGNEYKYRVPMNKAIEYSEKDLLIDPYLLGVWLGNGTSKENNITFNENDVDFYKEKIEKLGSTADYRQYGDKAPSLKIDLIKSGGNNTFKKNLIELNLLGNKHIPRIYLESSKEQRLELLRGLMDTDGYCSKIGQCEIAQTSNLIADGVSELLGSLGIKHKSVKKKIKLGLKDFETNMITFFTDKMFNCFSNKRKYENLKEKLSKRMQHKSIIDIREIPSVPTKCIAVNNDENLYLAGRNFTVTHNTTLLSAISLYMAIADGEGSPEIYFLATKLDQSRKGFDEAHKMVMQSPMLQKHLRKRQSDMYIDFNFGMIKPLASNTNGLDGLNGHCIIIDELGAIKNRDIYDLMKQSMSSRTQPLLVCITTNGFVREGIFDSQYEYAEKVINGQVKDNKLLPLIYELDDRSEWENEDMWVKSNPALNVIKSEAFLSECIEKAKNDPAFKPTVMVKDFNLKENAASTWLSWNVLENKEKFDFEKMAFKYGIGGFDAADTIDLNSAKVICMRPNDDRMYIRSMYWIPEDILNQMTTDGNRKERDNVPFLLWERQGLLRTWKGNKVDKRCFLEWFKELRDDGLYVYKIGFDPWHIDDSLLREFKAEFGEHSMVPIRQGVATLSQPMFSLKADLEANKILYNDNPIDKWCLANTEVKSDINGNIQPVKGLDNRKRIDGTISLLCAYIVLQDNKQDYINMI